MPVYRYTDPGCNRAHFDATVHANFKGLGHVPLAAARAREKELARELRELRRQIRVAETVPVSYKKL